MVRPSQVNGEPRQGAYFSPRSFPKPGGPMRMFSSLLVAACILCFTATFSFSDDNKGKAGTFSGVLIDQACGAKMMTKDDPEKAAADHPRSCATKEACEK